MTYKFSLGAITAAVAVLSLSAFTTSTPSRNTVIPTVPTAVPAPAVARGAEEPHPEIRRAIAALRKARFHLEHAAHDFGGHRVAALKACDDAIAQLQLALQYDKN